MKENFISSACPSTPRTVSDVCSENNKGYWVIKPLGCFLFVELNRDCHLIKELKEAKKEDFFLAAKKRTRTLPLGENRQISFVL